MTRAQSPFSFPRRNRGAFLALPVLLCWAAVSSAGVPVAQLHPVAAFSQPVNGRTPASAFLTDLGVYELDTAGKSVRVWQRSDEGLELLLPKNGDAMTPFTSVQIEQQRPQRFFGVDAAGDGIVFKQPVGFDKHPSENKFAVLSVGEFISQGLNQYSPSIQVYDFAETAGTDGALSSVSITLADEFKNAFYVTTNGMQQIQDRIYSYPDILVTTNYYSDGTIAAVTTNRFFSCTTNLLDRNVFTNWVLVLQNSPTLETQTNIVSQTGLEEPLFIDENDTSLFIPGFEYTILRIFDRYSVTTNFYSLTNYVWRYSTTTNANYLSTATDVAFLGDAGFVASIVSEDFQAERSALLVFGSDPETPAKLFPVGDLDRGVRGIAVDAETGDVYATVPDAHAVFRYLSPGGTPASWTTVADRTPVFHDGFMAGVTNKSGSAFGLLSNPADAAVWRPDDGGPILLVADTANNRVQAFDPNSSFVQTNWLGTNLRVPTTPDGLPEDPELQFVVLDAVTNWYRLEETAFPLFVTASSEALNNPKGVFGSDGEAVLAVADSGARRVRVYEVGLDSLDSEEILAMAVRWPSDDETWHGLAARDLSVTNGAAWWDRSSGSATPSLVVRELQGFENELRFTVAPSRKDRTYTLSVADAAGAVTPMAATVTVPAGATEGVLTFTADDGIVDYEEEVSWRDQFGNWAAEGSQAAVSAVTNRVAVVPVYSLSVSSGGWSTNATLAVDNVAPAITNAVFSGYVVYTMSGPILYVQGMHVDARDWVDADEDLRYLWWASTNINWAANNLDWAVYNNEWADSASDQWSEGPSVQAVQNTTASVVTGTETSGPVTNTVELLVAVGRDAIVPYGYDEDGILATTDLNNAPFIAVCTVLDKDGAAAIITFPTAPDTSGTADRWSYDGGGGGGGGGGGDESDAVYAARFTRIAGNNVTFVVTLEYGTPLASDTVTLESATSLGGPWTKLGTSKKVGDRFLAGETSVEITVNSAGGGDVRFYRIVQP